MSVQELTDEATMVLRAARRLKPGETENFSVNRASLLSQGFDAVFKGINMAAGSSEDLQSLLEDSELQI